MVTTNLFTQPVFKDGGFTNNDRGVRRYALRKVMRNLDLAAELGAETYVFWGGREGSEVDSAKDISAALDRYREGIDTARRIRQGAGLRPPLRPRAQAERAARRHLLPTVGTRSPSSPSSSTAEMVGVNPEVGHEQMAGLNFTHGIAQALWAGKLFHIDLNGQRGIKFDQDLVFGHGDLFSAFATSTCSRTAHRAAGRAYDGPRHFDYKPLAHRGHGRRLEVRGGEHAHLPAAQGAGRGLPRRPRGRRGDGRRPRWPSSPRRPWARARPYADLLADRGLRGFDAVKAGERGVGFVRLNQLALEHLLGARA